MMTMLLESAAARGPRRTPWAAVSFAAHAAVIATAIALTTQVTGDPVRPAEPTEQPIYIPVPQEPPDRAPAPRPPGMTLIAAPLRAPINVPSTPTFDPAVPFAPAPLAESEIFGRPGPIDAPPRGPFGDVIHTTATVERIASPLAGNGHPEYPRTLQRSNVEGEVLAQFVVDSAGRVEPGSITIVRATHPLFADAVRHWLPRTRYAPAEIAARRVRQLVQQEIGFALRPQQ